MLIQLDTQHSVALGQTVCSIREAIHLDDTVKALRAFGVKAPKIMLPQEKTAYHNVDALGRR